MNMNPSFQHSNYDAIVVGSRCAGAATALNLSRQGARVLMIDRDTQLHDTLSTHALMRPAVTMLAKWGVLDQIIKADTPEVTRTRFYYGGEVADIQIKADGNVSSLVAPRRWLLDRVLREAAIQSGAELRTGVGFDGFVHNSVGRVVGARLRNNDGTTETVKCNIVIGADGRNSSVAQAANARSSMQCKTTTANVYAYVDSVPNEGYRWYYGPGIAAGLIPTTGNSHCLFAICRPDDFASIFADGAYEGALQMLSHWEPDIAADLARCGPAERPRRFLGHQGYLRDCTGSGWALVGDAGYFKDPVTAHGITDAFLDAHRLSEAFARTPGNLAAYRQQRDKHAIEFLRITEDIATLDWDFDTLKALHIDLNACMKAEARDIGRQEVQSPMHALAHG